MQKQIIQSDNEQSSLAQIPEFSEENNTGGGLENM